jgi:acetyltransferase-like isoleucine patch superfamily enzyme
MEKILKGKLKEIEEIIKSGLDAEGTRRILRIMEGPEYSLELINELTLYSELLPMGREPPLTSRERYLHFLWDVLDKLPMGLFVNFAMLLRRLIAEHLFKKCGIGFISEENFRFNFGQNIEVGDFVFFNRGVFVDSKGGVIIGNQVCLTEDVRIFTHTHSESSHIIREYNPVVIKDYAKIYTGAIILPGVTVGEQAIVAANSIVSQDVPPNMVVAGSPARVVRERKTEGRSGDELDHIWLY